jgi:flagellar assembly protein FliH
MDLSNRKVIKAGEIKLLSKPERVGAVPPVVNTAPSTDECAALKMELEASFAQKIQIAEREAHARGVSEGIKKGIEIQKNEHLKPLQVLNDLIKELSEVKKKMLEEAEEQIVELSLAVAEKVMHLEVTSNRDVIQGVLREAIKNIVDRENMKIRLHPDDFRYIMEIKSDFIRSFDGIKNIVFEEDVSVGRGGALIETVCGEVDARLDQQYNEVKTSMLALHR